MRILEQREVSTEFSALKSGSRGVIVPLLWENSCGIQGSFDGFANLEPKLTNFVPVKHTCCARRTPQLKSYHWVKVSQYRDGTYS
jgi:hypothetical protein